MAAAERVHRFPVGSDAQLEGDLSLPVDAGAVVVFAQGNAHGRHSPAHRAIAQDLRARGLGTLLVDLLTDDESGDRRHVFDTDRLTGRLVGIVDELHAELPHIRFGLFGIDTGAAGALAAAAHRTRLVASVVSHDGRPDLVDAVLERVEAPTLLIVVDADLGVLHVNRGVIGRLPRGSALEVVAADPPSPDGVPDRVVRLAGDWFARSLTSSGHR